MTGMATITKGIRKAIVAPILFPEKRVLLLNTESQKTGIARSAVINSWGRAPMTKAMARVPKNAYTAETFFFRSVDLNHRSIPVTDKNNPHMMGIQYRSAYFDKKTMEPQVAIVVKTCTASGDMVVPVLFLTSSVKKKEAVIKAAANIR